MEPDLSSVACILHAFSCILLPYIFTHKASFVKLEGLMNVKMQGALYYLDDNGNGGLSWQWLHGYTTVVLGYVLLVAYFTVTVTVLRLLKMLQYGFYDFLLIIS